MSLRLRLALALAGGALLTVSTPAGAIGAQRVASAIDATTVPVVMKEWSFKASVRTVPAGKVTFVVRNAGTMPHEFLVIRTDKPPKALPVRGMKAIEAGAKGRIRAFAPGATRRLTLDLAPGKYVLLCNVPGHYKAGQAITFVVSAAATVSAAQTTKVTASMYEMGFKLSKTTVPRGTVVFDVRNDGKLPHDFSFGSRGGGTRLLEPGESATLTVEFTKPGTYTYICTVEGHLEGGMIGVLTVT